VAKRVLIVEDEANILLSLVFVLEQEGYDVRSATTGRDGLAEMTRERPDLVILDLMLPDVSGYEVCQQARRDPALADTPILVLTARAQEAERQKGLAVGATEYLTKPFRVAELRDRVAHLLSSPS
jgi:two-component system, OmpR family, phosphate regulon response regulator PhoB